MKRVLSTQCQPVPYPSVKRAIDLIVALPLALLLAPLGAVIAALVRRADDGPAFYRADRVGKDGRPFTMLKFRTMVPNAESMGGSSTADGDPRLTRLAPFLRKYKLDELPQLINVIRGDMSLVGPRPQVAWDVDRYTQSERRLLSVRPGITDWASIEYSNEGEILAGEEDPDEAYDRLIRPGKIHLGLEYVDHISLKTDIRILWATARAVGSRH